MCSKFAPRIAKFNFTAVTELETNRAKNLISKFIGSKLSDIKNLTLWGNRTKT